MKIVKQAKLFWGMKSAKLVFEGTIEEYEKVKDHLDVELK